MKLQPGKKPHVYDERTILFSNFMESSLIPPAHYDFDKNRTPIPLAAYGSGKWRSDVIASTAYQILRLVRLDEKRTLPIGTNDITTRYRKFSKALRAGDENDTGLDVLTVMRNWRKKGWKLRGKNYKITLFGEIEPNDPEKMRSAIYLFKGVHIGLMIPEAVTEIFDEWDIEPGNKSAIWQPGEMGVLGFCKSYSPDWYELLLWGKRILVSNRFVEKYSDECWISVDKLDFWNSQTLDIPRLQTVYPWISRREEG